MKEKKLEKKNKEELKKALDYCFKNCTIKRLGEKNYHKYRSYKRRHKKGETLSYNAIHGMFKDFGIDVEYKYTLPKE